MKECLLTEAFGILEYNIRHHASLDYVQKGDCSKETILLLLNQAEEFIEEISFYESMLTEKEKQNALLELFKQYTVYLTYIKLNSLSEPKVGLSGELLLPKIITTTVDATTFYSNEFFPKYLEYCNKYK